MKKQNKLLGFTLIELLAVIVILAIIALIAVPIVINIIESNRKKAFVQTGNGIIAAAEYYYMNSIDGKKPTNNTIFEFKDGEIIVPEEAKDKEVQLEFNGEIPKEGTVTIDPEGKVQLIASNQNYCITKGFNDREVTIKKYDGSCTLSSDSDDKENGSNANVEYTFSELCDFVSGEALKTGAKYSCDVDPKKEGNDYDFYVLSENEDGTINLIMDRNICEDGTEATAKNTCLVAWYSESAISNSFGPVTAMDFVYNATKDWTNIPDMIMDYTDEGNTGDYGYGKIVTTDGVTKITKKDGTAVKVLTDKEGYTNLKARMPYRSEISDYDNINNTNGYLYDNLYIECYDSGDDGMSYTKVSCDTPYDKYYGVLQEGITHIDGIKGYWSLSSNDIASIGPEGYVESVSIDAWGAHYDGYVSSIQPDNDSVFGIRPVITLEI